MENSENSIEDDFPTKKIKICSEETVNNKSTSTTNFLKDPMNGCDSSIVPGPDKILVPSISKKQLKKMHKMKRWEEQKKEKRLKEREKYKKKRLEALAKGVPIQEGPSRKQLKRNKSEESSNFLKVAVDLEFDDLMANKEISKCVKQLLRIYTINRRSASPAKLIFCGVKENGRMHKTLEKNNGYQNWDVKWYFKSFPEVLDISKVIYLTSDSDEELSELDKESIYIIGGLVDHNHHKGVCFEKAKKLGLKTARLPLNKYVDLKTRTVLCTYHVFEILLRISEGKNWLETILEVLPTRKGAKKKNTKEDDHVTELNHGTTNELTR